MKRNNKSNWLRNRKGKIHHRWYALCVVLVLGLLLFAGVYYRNQELQKSLITQELRNSIYATLPERLQPNLRATSAPDFRGHSIELQTACGQLTIQDFTTGSVTYDINLILEMIDVYCEVPWQVPIQVDIQPQVSVTGRSGRIELLNTPPQDTTGPFLGLTFLSNEENDQKVVVIIPIGYYYLPNASRQLRDVDIESPIATLNSEDMLTSTFVHELLVHAIERAENPDDETKDPQEEIDAMVFQVKIYQQLAGRPVFQFSNR